MNERLAGDRYVVDAGIVFPRVIVYGLAITLVAALPAIFIGGAIAWKGQSDQITVQQGSIEDLRKTVQELRTDAQRRDGILDERVSKINEYAQKLEVQVGKLQAIMDNVSERVPLRRVAP
jgi:archaellum component FlaC